MEFPDLGERCRAAGCSQLDFLPFQCAGCRRSFCLEHRLPEKHACTAPQTSAADVRVVVCPICAKGIRVPPGEDADVMWARHASTSECDPANYDRVNRKPRCVAPGCREKLTFSNRFDCKECGASVCLKHRFGDDHACEERRRRVEELRRRARLSIWGGRGRGGCKKEQQDRSCMKGGCRMM